MALCEAAADMAPAEATPDGTTDETPPEGTTRVLVELAATGSPTGAG